MKRSTVISVWLAAVLVLAASAQPLRGPDVTDAPADSACAAFRDNTVGPRDLVERPSMAVRTPYAADFPMITLVPGRLGGILRALERQVRELAAAPHEISDSAVTTHDCTGEVVP